MNDPTIRLYRGPDTLSPKKLAGKLGVCVRTLYRWIDRGKIPQGTRQGKYLVWHVADLPRDLAQYGREQLLKARTGWYWLVRKASSPLSAVG